MVWSVLGMFRRKSFWNVKRNNLINLLFLIYSSQLRLNVEFLNNYHIPSPFAQYIFRSWSKLSQFLTFGLCLTNPVYISQVIFLFSPSNWEEVDQLDPNCNLKITNKISDSWKRKNSENLKNLHGISIPKKVFENIKWR